MARILATFFMDGWIDAVMRSLTGVEQARYAAEIETLAGSTHCM